MTSADIIRIARRRAGITQAELARRLERPRPNVARWESGSVSPSFETLQEIVRACGLEAVVDLFTFDDSNDYFIQELLDLSPAERLQVQVAAARGWPRRRRGAKPFDPLAMLRELSGHLAGFLLLGRLAANLRGSPHVPVEAEVVAYLDPTMADEGLGAALSELRARPFVPDDGVPEAPLEVRGFPHAERWWIPRAGGVLVVVRDPPPGTAGFNDLARDASLEELDGDLAVVVPSTLDLIRIADASPHIGDKVERPVLVRALELARGEPRAPRVPQGLEELFAAHDRAA